MSRLALIVVPIVVLAGALSTIAGGQTPLSELIDAMGARDYQAREQAMTAVIARGREIVPTLEKRLAIERDPEIRHRIRYVLAAILPPDQAVLILRTWKDSGLKPGDILTHIDHRRIRRPAELARFARQPSRGRRLRVNGPDGPRELAEFNLESLVSTCAYRAPRGEDVAQAVRLYATGFAERSYELLERIGPSVPPSELPPLLRAIIAHTAGHETEALSTLHGAPDAVRPTMPRRPWHSPSLLDLSGPLKAPYRLESVLWRELFALEDTDRYRDRDRDRSVQRVLVPANRLVDALLRSSGMWHHQFRDKLLNMDPSELVTAGNMLAVTAWMLSDVDLLSESIDLIAPRSAFLPSTWVRVQLKSWKAFLAGSPSGALDEVYDDALQIMTKFDPDAVLIRNTDIAAQVAFFLYQMPTDPRVAQMLEIMTGDVTNPGYLSLAPYARSMCYAVHPQNAGLVARDLMTIVPHLPEGAAATVACRLTMLQYVADEPDLKAMRSVRRYVERSQDLSDRDAWLAACDGMALLAEGKIDAARAVLAPHKASWITRGLLHTAEFRGALPPTAADRANIAQCRLALPVGEGTGDWLVLTRARKLVRFESKAKRWTTLEAPTPSWYPGPLNWPWLDRDESTGRVWTYARRRVFELCRDTSDALRININTDDIPGFSEHGAPVFERLARAVAAAPLKGGERGDFLRADIKAAGEYVADPDLPELGLIEVSPADPRILHIAIRGGPQLIVERATGRTWSSHWIGQQLDLPAPPTFFVQAVPQQPQPVLILPSDQGVIRFDLAGQKLTRIPLPGADAYPIVIPERTPYQRRDPRWIYCARLPAVGAAPRESDGRVYRILMSDNSVEELDMINEGLPAAYYAVRSRADIRREIDARLRAAGIPALPALIADVRRLVAEKFKERP